MPYKIWLESHSIKHKKIVDKLVDLTNDEIIKYFNFENMVKKEIDFCPLYKNNLKCHEMEDLNCYLCACPNFRVSSKKSYCDINSVDGNTITDKNGFIHQDCSLCTVPHKKEFTKEKFNKNWSVIMKNSIVENK